MRFCILFLLFVSISSLASKDIPAVVWQAEKAVWKIEGNQNKVTGVFIDKKHIATNLHVVFKHLENNQHSLQKLQLSQKGKKSDIKLKKIRNLSVNHDLIIFETDQEVSDYLKLPSETPELTDSIFAIGYPKGSFQIIQNTNSYFANDKHTIHIPFNFVNLNGASGSPILNEKGEIIGIAQSSIFNMLTIIKLAHLKKLMKSSNYSIDLSKNKSNVIESLIRKKSLEPNDSSTRFIRGILFNEKKKFINYEKNSFYQFEKSAKEGHARAQATIGVMLHFGKGVKKNLKEALDWYKKAAQQNDLNAQFNLAMMYYNGEGVEKDIEKAFDWIKKAAEGGYALAQYQLSMMYYNGEGVEKNVKKSFFWLELVAEQGDVWAQYQLAEMFYEGEGVDQNFEKAFDWILQATQQAYLQYQNEAELEKIDHVFKKAFILYEKLAEKGFVPAQFKMGVMLYHGGGVEKDIERAINSIQLAAEQGFAPAQYELAMILHKEGGAKKDFKTIVYWLEQSAKQGHLEAQDKLKSMKKQTKISSQCRAAF